MAVIHVKRMPEFYLGDDVVLLAADREGIEPFESALADTTKKEKASSHLTASGTSHEFHIGGSEARVELIKGHVIWRLSDEKACEILDRLAGLKASKVPSHHYVDINSPAETLILSVEEYLDAFWLNEG